MASERKIVLEMRGKNEKNTGFGKELVRRNDDSMTPNDYWRLKIGINNKDSQNFITTLVRATANHCYSMEKLWHNVLT